MEHIYTSNLKKKKGNGKNRKLKEYSNKRPEEARCLMSGPEGRGKRRGGWKEDEEHRKRVKAERKRGNSTFKSSQGN